MDSKAKEWDKSYDNKDNFVFYPHEGVIRFVSKYIRKRIGLSQFSDQEKFESMPTVLDFGCGIGRHVKLLHDFGLDGYGFDLSTEAISIAKSNFKEQNLDDLIQKVIVANITELPYKDNEFSFMLSHGVLDSMPFEIARKGMHELHRCLKKNGKVYFDLISIENAEEYEEIVDSNHEKGTVQSYFDSERIQKLVEGLFQIEELTLITNKSLLNNSHHGRFQVIVKKIK